jgi:hypothetical protein
MGDQIDKLKTDMGVKAVVLRHDDHDQEMKSVYKILHFVIFVYNTKTPCLFAFSGRQIFMKLPIELFFSFFFFYKLSHKSG